MKASHAGVMRIGDAELPCANLPGGVRVISEAAMMTALGRSYSGYYSQRDASADPGSAVLPRYMAPAALKPFISEDLANLLSQPIAYLPPGAGRPAKGVDARVLPQICEVWLKARAAGKLTDPQLRTAEKAEIIVLGLASVGIIALVDEATGYQADRERDELAKILEAYIAEEMRGWVRTFPPEFFKQIYRLHEWTYTPGDTKTPRYVGKLIDKYIYRPLPPGVRDELRSRNPAVNGRRRHKHFMFLTEDAGVPHLEEQIRAVTLLMRGADNKGAFERAFKRVFPSPGDQCEIPIDSTEE